MAHLGVMAQDTEVAAVFAAVVLFGFGFGRAWADEDVPVEKEDGEESEENERDCNADGEFGVVGEVGRRSWSGCGGAVGVDGWGLESEDLGRIGGKGCCGRRLGYAGSFEGIENCIWS